MLYPLSYERSPCTIPRPGPRGVPGSDRPRFHMRLTHSLAQEQDTPGSVGAWAKGYYFAVRAAMESVLRPYDLGSTQWYVLYQLANVGPTVQRDLGRNAPGRKGNAQRDRGDAGAEGTRGPGARLRRPAPAGTSDHLRRDEALGRTARSARPHSGDRVRGLGCRGTGNSCSGAPGRNATTQRSHGSRQLWEASQALTVRQRRNTLRAAPDSSDR